MIDFELKQRSCRVNCLSVGIISHTSGQSTVQLSQSCLDERLQIFKQCCLCEGLGSRPITAFNGTSDVLLQSKQKDLTFIEGMLLVDLFSLQDAHHHISPDVVFLENFLFTNEEERHHSKTRLFACSNESKVVVLVCQNSY